MSGWRNGWESAINEKRLGGNRGATVTFATSVGADAKRGTPNALFSHKLRRLTRETCALTITQPKARGEAVRAALLAIVRARYAAGLPLPSNAAMGAALGLSASQVSRHMNVLMDQGAFSVRCHGMHTRIELEDAA